MTTKINNKILISGLPRSGSTLLGNIIGSAKNVEYFFEPPMISPLLGVIDELNPESFKSTFEYYITNELLTQSLAGRRLNFNENDDSCIFRYKSKIEINNRLIKSWRASEIRSALPEYSVAFKTPGISTSLLKLMNYFPSWRLVIIFRTYEDILNSIMVKGWFDDKNPNIITPFKKFGPSKVPISISDIWKDEWPGLSPIERSMIYMNDQFSALSELKNYTRISYEDIVGNSHETVTNLFNSLGINETQKTHKLLLKIYDKKGLDKKTIPSHIDSRIKKEALFHKKQFNI